MNHSTILNIYSINTSDANDVYTLPVEINGRTMDVVCDTGAPCTLFPASLYYSLCEKEKLHP